MKRHCSICFLSVNESYFPILLFFFLFATQLFFCIILYRTLCEKRANSSGSRSIWNYDAVATAICIFQQIIDYNHPSSMCKILTLKSSNEGAIASISKITAGFGIQHDLCKYIPLLYSTTLKRDCLNGCTFWQIAAVLVIFQVQLNTIVLKKKALFSHHSHSSDHNRESPAPDNRFNTRASAPGHD